MFSKPRFRVQMNELQEYVVSYKIGLFGTRWYIKDYYSWFSFSIERGFECRLKSNRWEAALKYAREMAARDIRELEEGRKRDNYVTIFKEP